MSSSSGPEVNDSKRKRSQAIDRTLEEDSKKLRRECKILLLGKSTCRVVFVPPPPSETMN